ncbi:MAG: hypothetical protein PHX70_01335 [Clostridium sp.]|nr:hypothetical protein [Clostridium sp.]
MIFLLFIISCFLCLFFIYHYSNIVYSQKKQMMILTKENNLLKNKLSFISFPLKDIKLYYKIPKYTFAILGTPCNLYIAPIKNCTIIKKLRSNISIEILDSAEVNNEIWYEIRFKSNDNVNNKGWILGNNISLFKNSSDFSNGNTLENLK